MSPPASLPRYEQKSCRQTEQDCLEKVPADGGDFFEKGLAAATAVTAVITAAAITAVVAAATAAVVAAAAVVTATAAAAVTAAAIVAVEQEQQNDSDNDPAAVAATEARILITTHSVTSYEILPRNGVSFHSMGVAAKCDYCSREIR